MPQILESSADCLIVKAETYLPPILYIIFLKWWLHAVSFSLTFVVDTIFSYVILFATQKKKIWLSFDILLFVLANPLFSR